MIKALEEVQEYNHHAISTHRHTLSTLERRHPNAVILCKQLHSTLLGKETLWKWK